MEKIDSFKITGLTVEGFKCFAEKSSYRFGDMSVITGHNGQGKSSIAEAVAYAVTGFTLYGEQSLDRLYALGGKYASVELTIEVNGENHILTRSRRSDVTTMTYDGVTVRQSDLNTMFGERDVFLSIFNPLYFIEILGEKGRGLLERYLPAIPHETVLSRLGEHPRKLLENQKMKSPEALLETVRADIKNLEDTIIYVEGQRDLLESQARDRKNAIKDKRGEIDVLDVKLKALEAKRAEVIGLEEMQAKLGDLYARYSELSHDSLLPPDTSGVDAETQTVLKALAEKRSAEYVSDYTVQIAELGAAVAQLRDQYAKENTILSGLNPGIKCPTCKHSITEQNVESVRKEFADSIAGIMEKGRSASMKHNELKAADEQARTGFYTSRDIDIAMLETDLEELRLQRLEVISNSRHDADKRSALMESIKAQIQTLELDMRYGNLADEEGWELDSLKTGREKLETELKALNDADADPGAVSMTGDIESIKESIKAKRELEETVKFYISERARLMLEGFGSLNRVEIVLFEPVKKTGLAKDVFKFSYEGKPYKFLSLSEKIKAGLEVSELIKRLTCRNYPVFIDNGESIPVIDNMKPSGQIFVAQVVKGAPLEVSGAPELLKAAA